MFLVSFLYSVVNGASSSLSCVVVQVENCPLYSARFATQVLATICLFLEDPLARIIWLQHILDL